MVEGITPGEASERLGLFANRYYNIDYIIVITSYV